jgi:hypothetical protein
VEANRESSERLATWGLSALAFVLLLVSASIALEPTGAPRRQNATSDTPYAFLTDHRGTPAAWDCSRPIEVAVRRHGVDDAVLDDVFAAMDLIAEHSQFEFRFVGFTDAVPDSTFDDWWSTAVPAAPVVVAFVDAGESDLLGGKASANGGGDWSLNGGRPQYTSGSVLVDVEKLRVFSAGSGFKSRQGLFAHELLHVLNLAHVEDPNSLMAKHLDHSFGQIGPGDIAGLAHLGRLGCGG